MTFDELYADLQKQTTNEEKVATFKLIETLLTVHPNDPAGHRTLGFAYLLGLGTAKDEQKAFLALKRGAELKDYKAIRQLAVCYYNGQGTEKNLNLAVEHCNVAACMVEDKAKREAFQNLVIIADQNPTHADVNVHVASFYSRGKNDVEFNYSKAIPYYTRAAQANDKCGNYSLGMIHANGLGVPKDIPKGCEYYLKAAQLGEMKAITNCETLNCPEAWYMLGRYYQNDLEKARPYFEKAIKENHAKSLATLIGITNDEKVKLDLFEIGLQMPKPQSEVIFEALKTFCIANPNNARALFVLGRAYYNGYGIRVNPEEAFKNYRKAVDLNYTPALKHLADCYALGYGVNKDAETAVRLMYEAEKKRDPHRNSLKNMQRQATDATRYELGATYALHNDYQSARQAFMASQHDDRSLCYLGKLYELGLGVEKDLKLAAHYYLESAKINSALNEGSREAVEHLKQMVDQSPYILCCENGWGIQENPRLAIAHYAKEVGALYKRINENEFKAHELPNKLIEFLKLNDSLFRNELKILIATRNNEYDSRDSFKAYQFQSKLIATLQNIVNCPANISFILDDKELRAELGENKSTNEVVQRLLDFLARYQVIQHYIQQIRLAMSDLKKEMALKTENKEWRKSIGIMWINGRPNGVKKAQSLIETFESMDDINLLKAHAELCPLFEEKKEKLDSRHTSSVCFYANWHHVHSRLSLHADYEKLRVKQPMSTTLIQSQIIHSPVNRVVEAMSDGWYDLIEAKKAKPITSKPDFDFSAIPNPPIPDAPIPAQIAEPPVPSIYPKKNDDLLWLLSSINPPQKAPEDPQPTRSLVLA